MDKPDRPSRPQQATAPLKGVEDFMARAAFLAREEAKYFLRADLDKEKQTVLERLHGQCGESKPTQARLRELIEGLRLQARAARIAGAATSAKLVELERMAEASFEDVPDYPTPDALLEISARRRRPHSHRSSGPLGSAPG